VWSIASRRAGYTALSPGSSGSVQGASLRGPWIAPAVGVAHSAFLPPWWNSGGSGWRAIIVAIALFRGLPTQASQTAERVTLMSMEERLAERKRDRTDLHDTALMDCRSCLVQMRW